MGKTANLSLVRLMNYKQVGSVLHRYRRATIPQLAREVGLSVPAVTRAVEYGLQKGLLRPVGFEGAERGRKAQVYEINASYMHFLLITADHRRLYFQVHDMMSRVLQSGSFPVKDDTILSQMDGIVSDYMRSDSLIAMIAIALPGAVHRGKIIDSQPYPSLAGISFSEHFSYLALRDVLVVSDMQVAALAAACYSGEMEGITVVFSFGRESCGAGVLIDGKVLKGAAGAAAQLDMLPLPRAGRDEIAFYAEKLQALIAVLNPDRVILHAYDADLTGEMLVEALSSMPFPYMKPIFISGRAFFSDCFTGLSLLCEKELKGGFD